MKPKIIRMSAMLFLVLVLALASCVMLGEPVSHESASPKKAWHFETVIWSIPIGPQEIGNGRQFEHDDFSSSQWRLRQVTPNL